ncbi:hypothetical protein [Silvibacterium acidisoli]|uniref:hypothetical protein n=1 Tax=Acidobacteriaceae bacterium ZG23-2 TaxID=2883246 RepID=UPI00406D37AC
MSRNPLAHSFLRISALACAALALPALGQYPGRIDPNQSKPEPVLRATAVLEYTGDLTKPTASRLVPLAVWDGERYQPGGLYMAQPMPMAVETGTQYELYTAGVSKGLFDVKAAANIGGSWIAVGNFQKPVPPQVARLKKSKNPPQIIDGVNYDDGKPHFAHRPPQTQSSDGKSSSTDTKSSGTSNAPTVDPDRPTLHRRDSSGGDSSSSSSSTGSSGSSTPTSSAPPVDPDRPTLHRPNDSGNSGSSTTASNAPATDPDRPKLHRGNSNSSDNGAPVSATTDVDPDRPRLRRGRPTEYEQLDVPANVEIAKVEKASQNVELIAAVSDARIREPHPYVYSWNSPDDAQKAKSALEDQARTLLGGSPKATAKPAPARTTPPKTAAARAAAARARAKAAATAPMELHDELFKAYELSFGGGATLVFSASTGEGDATKYVTLIAQPDFNGVPQVIYKQVTTRAQLDVLPRMEIVDAVDTDADNRAELVFALATSTDRQYAIYRVADHSVQQVFSTGS